MADETKPIHWAAGLVEALKATHTGQGKLDLIRAAMAERHNHPDHAGKPADHPDRHLTAAEAVAVLERAGVGEMTLEKARQLMGTGMWTRPAPVNPADALPPPPAGPAPDRATAASAAVPTSRAGVRDLSADVDSVGLKRVADAKPKPRGKPAAKGKAEPKPKRGGAKTLLPASEPAGDGSLESEASAGETTGGDAPGG